MLLFAALLYIFRAQARIVLRLLLGGVVTAFLLSPLCEWLCAHTRKSRALCAILSFAAVALALIGILLLLVPPLTQQFRELFTAMPAMIASIRRWIDDLNQWLANRGYRFSVPNIAWDSIPWERILWDNISWEKAANSLSPLWGGAVSAAGNVAGAMTELTLALMLGYYFLRDKERLNLQLELLAPARARKIALRMCAAIRREMSTYLRGQLIISAMVAGLSALGMLLAGVQAFLALGFLVGIFNLIPYFGPLIGAIPAVLMALLQNPQTALWTMVALFLVQQIDGMIISPRIMGSVTGLHPALVLLGITVGGSVGGLTGMLFAIPAMLVIRAIIRIWVMRYEKV